MTGRLDVDVTVESADWPEEVDWRAVCARPLEAAAARCGVPLRPHAAVSVLLTDDAGVRELNRDWRDKDRPTNVLSFQAVTRDQLARAPALGDIVVARGTLLREAAEEGKSAAAHLDHLLVHGFLHLLCFDHQDDSEAARMETLETAIVTGLGHPDPYAGFLLEERAS